MTFRFLASYAYYRQIDMSDLITSLRRAYQGPVELFADSGAFSADTLGITVKLTDYAAWLRHWHPLINVAATLDVIGDHQATARNTGRLLDTGLQVLPTFHVGTPWPVLKNLCRRHRYLALGGMVPHSSNPKAVMRWLVKAFRIARDHNAVFHGFGQTTYTSNAALPFYSVDSSSWGAGVRYGRLYLWDDRLNRLKTTGMGSVAEARAHTRLLHDHGLDPAVVGRPGFAQRAHRDKARYDTERQMATGATAHAWQLYEKWLRERHKVAPPPGRSTTGTVVYLAESEVVNLQLAASFLGSRKAAST